jgi:MoaA/NifB/PqqE/SkfB family radical SAM enzyme
LLIITGGECFTLGKDLNLIIKYASSKGLFTRVVTNGYWAKSPEKAYLKLNRLVEAGLNELNFSTGDEHQTWVPYENIVNGIVSALELELTTVVNVESSKLSKFNIEQLKNDYRLEKYKHLLDKKLHIINGVWMPFLKSGEEKIDSSNDKDLENSLIVFQKKKRCSSLFNTISIDPFHQAIACCGLTVEYIKYLHLGNTKKYSLKFLYEYQFQDFLKIWLFTEGPENILKFCRNKLNLPPIDTTKWHICQICVEIFRDKQNILILQQNYEEVFSNVMLKYSLLREKYLKTTIN